MCKPNLLDLELYRATQVAAEQGERIPLPADASEAEALCVLRALLDLSGEIAWRQGQLRLQIVLPTQSIEALSAHFEGGRVEAAPVGGAMTWYGLIALDLLGAALALGTVDGKPIPWGAEFRQLTQRVPELGENTRHHAEIRVHRLSDDAVMPSKTRISDSGYDITLISEKKRIGQTVLFGTGLIVEPPWGWYFDVVPRSSIIKTGYIMANSVGIIDRAYRGELMVPLLKLDDRAAPLALPFRAAQLIPRPIVHFPLTEADSLDNTARGAQGFGSSG